MSSPLAYRVPFRLLRRAHIVTLTNISDEPIAGVSLSLHGGGVLAVSPSNRLAPGESVEVRVAGHNLARNSILVVRWFRPDGVEYLWRVSF